MTLPWISWWNWRNRRVWQEKVNECVILTLKPLNTNTHVQDSREQEVHANEHDNREGLKPQEPSNFEGFTLHRQEIDRRQLKVQT